MNNNRITQETEETEDKPKLFTKQIVKDFMGSVFCVSVILGIIWTFVIMFSPKLLARACYNRPFSTEKQLSKRQELLAKQFPNDENSTDPIVFSTGIVMEQGNTTTLNVINFTPKVYNAQSILNLAMEINDTDTETVTVTEFYSNLLSTPATCADTVVTYKGSTQELNYTIETKVSPIKSVNKVAAVQYITTVKLETDTQITEAEQQFLLHNLEQFTDIQTTTRADLLEKLHYSPESQHIYKVASDESNYVMLDTTSKTITASSIGEPLLYYDRELCTFTRCIDTISSLEGLSKYKVLQELKEYALASNYNYTKGVGVGHFNYYEGILSLLYSPRGFIGKVVDSYKLDKPSVKVLTLTASNSSDNITTQKIESLLGENLSITAELTDNSLTLRVLAIPKSKEEKLVDYIMSTNTEQLTEGLTAHFYTEGNYQCVRYELKEETKLD